MAGGIEVSCPRCGSTEAVVVRTLPEPLRVGAQSLHEFEMVTCGQCRQCFEVRYTAAIEVTIDGIESFSGPPVEFTCPTCNAYFNWEDLPETGTMEVFCEDCSTTFEIDWQDWGREVEVTPPR